MAASGVTAAGGGISAMARSSWRNRPYGVTLINGLWRQYQWRNGGIGWQPGVSGVAAGLKASA